MLALRALLLALALLPGAAVPAEPSP